MELDPFLSLSASFHMSFLFFIFIFAPNVVLLTTSFGTSEQTRGICDAFRWSPPPHRAAGAAALRSPNSLQFINVFFSLPLFSIK